MMLLLGSQQDRSVVDRIGSALQQRAQGSPFAPASSSYTMTDTTPASSPSPGQKRLAAPSLDCDILCKKPMFTTEMFKTGEDENSDSETSDQCTTEDGSECISPKVGPSGMNDVFCSVPGRLSLLSSTSKYKVTLGEIQRRLSNPESLNASILGGILRRAKSKNGGKELRDTLERMGLSLPAGRRKSATVTLLTSMVEGEAMHLARDFTYICDNEFPAEDVARAVNKRRRQDLGIQRRKESLMGTLEVLTELAEILSKDRSPIMGSSPEALLESDLQNPLSHFSLCTHGFGTPALLAAVNVVLKYVRASLNLVEPARPSAVPAAPPTSQGLSSGTASSPSNLLLALHPSVSLAAILQSEMLKMVEASHILPHKF